MVHLTVAIAKFFGYLIGALFQTGLVAVAVVATAALAVGGAGIGLRRLIARRRL